MPGFYRVALAAYKPAQSKIMVIHANATVAAITPQHDTERKRSLGREILAGLANVKRNHWQHGERFALAVAQVRDAADSGRDCLAELTR